MRALIAAAQATTAAKIRALGRALATGVLAEDDALVDQELYVVDALARMEAPHVRVLDLLVTDPPPRDYEALGGRPAPDAWFITELAGSYPKAGGLIPSLVSTLVALGAAEDINRGPTGYGPMFRVAAFGRLLLHRLHAAGQP